MKGQPVDTQVSFCELGSDLNISLLLLNLKLIIA